MVSLTFGDFTGDAFNFASGVFIVDFDGIRAVATFGVECDVGDFIKRFDEAAVPRATVISGFAAAVPLGILRSITSFVRESPNCLPWFFDSSFSPCFLMISARLCLKRGVSAFLANVVLLTG